MLVRARRSWGRIHFQAHVVVDSLQFLAHGWTEGPSFLLFWLEAVSCHMAVLQHANLLLFFFSEEDNTFTTCFFKASRGTLSLCKTDVKISCNVIICRYSCTFHHFCHILMVKRKPNPNEISVLGGYAWVCMPRGSEITEATLESFCPK